MAEVRWGGYEGVYADRAADPLFSPRVIGTTRISRRPSEGAARLITGTAHGRPARLLPRHTDLSMSPGKTPSPRTRTAGTSS